MNRQLCKECNGYKTIAEEGMCVECSQHEREELLKRSAAKPIRTFLQLDVFTEVEGGDSIITPDEDGDCLFSSVGRELNISDCVRLLIPIGESKTNVRRALGKMLETLDSAFKEIKRQSDLTKSDKFPKESVRVAALRGALQKAISEDNPKSPSWLPF